MTAQACVGQDPTIWADSEWTDTAKRICGFCPSLLTCLDWALVNDVDGVCGGLTETERQDVRRKRGIPQPKPAAAFDSRDVIGEAVLRLSATGMRPGEIARELGIGDRRVSRIRERHGLSQPVHPAPCGTDGAYRRHLRAGEHCEVCLTAHASRNRARDQRRRERRQQVAA